MLIHAIFWLFLQLFNFGSPCLAPILNSAHLTALEWETNILLFFLFFVFFLSVFYVVLTYKYQALGWCVELLIATIVAIVLLLIFYTYGYSAIISFHPLIPVQWFYRIYSNSIVRSFRSTLISTYSCQSSEDPHAHWIISFSSLLLICSDAPKCSSRDSNWAIDFWLNYSSFYICFHIVIPFFLGYR